MRSAALLLILLAATAVAPAVGAQVPTVARCNQVYCFSLLDEDGDGAPDGLIGGTAPVLHDAPTATFRADNRSLRLTSETLLGHEDEESHLATTYLYVELVDGGRGVRTAYADAHLEEHDGEGGSPRTMAAAALLAHDGDGDGAPEAVDYRLLP